MRKRVARHKCSVLGCQNARQYDHPAKWCRVHWDRWWHWSSYTADEPLWMQMRFIRLTQKTNPQ